MVTQHDMQIAVMGTTDKSGILLQAAHAGLTKRMQQQISVATNIEIHNATAKRGTLCSSEAMRYLHLILNDRHLGDVLYEWLMLIFLRREVIHSDLFAPLLDRAYPRPYIRRLLMSVMGQQCQTYLDALDEQELEWTKETPVLSRDYWAAEKAEQEVKSFSEDGRRGALRMR